MNYSLFTPDEKHRVNVYASAQHIGRDSYYGTEQNLNAYGETEDLTVVAGTQYIYSFDKCLFMPADLTAGIEYNYDNLRDEMKGIIARLVKRYIPRVLFCKTNGRTIVGVSLLEDGWINII